MIFQHISTYFNIQSEVSFHRCVILSNPCKQRNQKKGQNTPSNFHKPWAFHIFSLHLPAKMKDWAVMPASRSPEIQRSRSAPDHETGDSELGDPKSRSYRHHHHHHRLLLLLHVHHVHQVCQYIMYWQYWSIVPLLSMISHKVKRQQVRSLQMPFLTQGCIM